MSTTTIEKTEESAAETLATIPHVVGGERLAPEGRRGAVYNPATGRQTAEVAFASADFVHQAAETAKAAQPAWRETGLAKRSAVMFRLREIISSRTEELARVITSEHGKTVADAMGEVARGLENVEFCTGLMHHLKGEYSEQVAGASTFTRFASRSAWSRASRPSTSPRWCRCGWSRPPSPPATP